MHLAVHADTFGLLAPSYMWLYTPACIHLFYSQRCTLGRGQCFWPTVTELALQFAHTGFAGLM